MGDEIEYALDDQCPVAGVLGNILAVPLHDLLLPRADLLHIRGTGKGLHCRRHAPYHQILMERAQQSPVHEIVHRTALDIGVARLAKNVLCYVTGPAELLEVEGEHVHRREIAHRQRAHALQLDAEHRTRQDVIEVLALEQELDHSDHVGALLHLVDEHERRPRPQLALHVSAQAQEKLP